MQTINYNEVSIISKQILGLNLPPVIFGTSSLGNLYTAVPDDVKLAIVNECIKHTGCNLVFDSAGKYGAGLALESLGKCLKILNVDREQVTISNKLGWVRTELTAPEPTFEPGVWKDLRHDAVQHISYEGIMNCFDQGNELLNGYAPSLVSVHDPDEYLAKAVSPEQEQELYADILEAYRALTDLKKRGAVKAIGVGAKDWKVIERIASDVKLDWIMIANSMTIKSHPADLFQFMKKLEREEVKIINSAVFHSGFLIGGDYYDYRFLDPNDPENQDFFKWRILFFEICDRYKIKPAHACIQFALQAPGVTSIALNTTNPARVQENVKMVHEAVPDELWDDLISNGLVKPYFFEETIAK